MGYSTGSRPSSSRNRASPCSYTCGKTAGTPAGGDRTAIRSPGAGLAGYLNGGTGRPWPAGPGRPRNNIRVEDRDAALRADIRRLGTLLGQTLTRQEGRPVLDLVEEVRALVRSDADAAAANLAGLDVVTGTKLARAFSTY